MKESRKIGDYLQYKEENSNSITMRQSISRVVDIGQAIQNVLVANQLEEQLKEDTVQRYELSEDTNIDAFLKENYQDEESKEYLVDGAILTCTNCTKIDIGVYDNGEEYVYSVKADVNADNLLVEGGESNKVYGKLVVNENQEANVEGKKYATVVAPLSA